MTHPAAQTSFFAVIMPIDTWALRGQADLTAIAQVSELDDLATRLLRASTSDTPHCGWIVPSRRLQEVLLGDIYSTSARQRPSGPSLLCTHTPYPSSRIIATVLWASGDTTSPYGAKKGSRWPAGRAGKHPRRQLRVLPAGGSLDLSPLRVRWPWRGRRSPPGRLRAGPGPYISYVM